MQVQIEISGDDGGIWQAIDTPEDVTATGFRGAPGEIADAVAENYARDQSYELAIERPDEDPRSRASAAGMPATLVRALVGADLWLYPNEAVISGAFTVEPNA